jgi:hypothetical protein
VTLVTGTIKAQRLAGIAFTAALCLCSHAQISSVSPASAGQPAIPDATGRPAESLYLQLRSVGLDPGKTFRIRGASIDRPALHITLEDGEISFTSDIAGHITGAFFAGDGELLLTPPNQVERASMAFFTKMAILEERFGSAYLRFNDDTFAQLQPFFRASDDASEFVARYNETAHNLAEQDALRLLGSFSRELPVSGITTAPTPKSNLDDQMLHIRVSGNQLGTFDVFYDSRAPEQVSAGQIHTAENGMPFYDLWTSFSPAVPHSAGKPPKARAEDVSIPQYKIRATIDPPTTLSAEAELQITVQHGGERTLYFELSRFLQVKSVEFNGRPVEFINNPSIDGTQLARRGNDLVAVVFPEALRDGQKLQLKFVYKGDVLSEAGGGLLYVGARGTWYPNRGFLMSQFDLEFHYPADWTLAATGRHIAAPGTSSDESAPSGDGEQVGRWMTEHPSVLAGFNLGKYALASAQAGAVPINVYAARSMEKTFPRATVTLVEPAVPIGPRPGTDMIIHAPAAPSPSRNAQAVADYGARAVDFFAQHFGPYPYPSLELTQMPGPMSQGWPGLVFLSSYAFLTSAQTEDLTHDSLQGSLNSIIVPHEIAHQWWGDLVGWRTYRDQWIVEALANYSALMLMETDKPGDVKKILERYRLNLLQPNRNDESLSQAGPVTLGLRLNSSHFPNGYDAVSYGRGTWLFHMLRHMLLDAQALQPESNTSPRRNAEEPFLRALRKLRDRYEGKTISTREFFAVFEEELPKPLWYEGHKSLNWFVQSWVEGVSIPQMSTHEVKFLKKPTGSEVRGILLQKDAPKDLVSAVPVYGVDADTSVLLGIVMADGPETPFQFKVPGGIRRIVLDPNHTMLANVK